MEKSTELDNHPPPTQETELVHCVHCVQLKHVTPPNVHNTTVLSANHQSPSNHGTKKMSPGEDRSPLDKVL